MTTSSHNDDDETTTKTNKTTVRVAVIGGGVAGLAAAWHLHTSRSDDDDAVYDVELFERESRLGGHAHTVKVDGVDVDVGFMVFNERNYPNLVRWFEALDGVSTEDSDMSLSVSLDDGQTVEWSSDGLDGLFANRRQMTSWAFFRFLRDTLRFHAEGPRLLSLRDDDPRRQVTTGEYLRRHGYSESFRRYYLLPMMAALWSASLTDVLRFPAAQLMAFLSHHRMLRVSDRPRWKTVTGRSRAYVTAVTRALEDGRSRVHLNAPVTRVVKIADGQWRLLASDGRELGTFDHVVMACHPPTAARMLSQDDDDDDDRRELLRSVHYADNVVYVHSDARLMPVRRRAWASWNCMGRSRYMGTGGSGTDRGGGENGAHGAPEGGASGPGDGLDRGRGADDDHHRHHHDDDAGSALEGPDGRMRAVYVTYWLNRLQNLRTPRDVFVSLNPHRRPDAGLTHRRLVLAHPQFTPATLRARRELRDRWQGRDNLWFAGAWGGYGFHEDGCRSGFEAAARITGTPLPWAAAGGKDAAVLPPPDLVASSSSSSRGGGPARWIGSLHRYLTYTLPVAACKRLVRRFLHAAVGRGRLILQHNDGSTIRLGDGTPCGGGCDARPVVLRVFDEWFYVRVALEYDLGLARSYMAGHFVVDPLDDAAAYHPVLRPRGARDETTRVLGDPVGLTRLFLLLIGNRDAHAVHAPRRAAAGHRHDNALTNASGLVFSKLGTLVNYIRYKLFMDNSERGGSLKNIHAHYDLSNDLFRTFLDKETLMYSSAIYDAVKAPSPLQGLVFRGTLEDAQWRKLDTLLDRAQVQPGQSLLDIGFGWGGLSLHAAKKYGCRVTGITLSVEQKALAEERVHQAGLQGLITFEVIDYRTFARQKRNLGRFDRVLSCEMIEAVGHEHLGEFFWAVEQVLAPNGILVMEAITTPEQRYETYLRSTDFINTVIFPGSCCPSLHALVDAAYKQSCLTLEHVDNIGLHYAQTLAEWRRRFNANEDTVRQLGFDDVFLRAWNYYLTYCEAGFFSQTENCLILVFARQGCASLAPLCESRSVTQPTQLTGQEVKNWLAEA